MRLIAFGDSWTAGHGVETDESYKEEAMPNFFIERLRYCNAWPRWLSDKLECTFVNTGGCGFGNQFILNHIEYCKQFMEKDDIVIVMLTYPYRYRNKKDKEIKQVFKEMEKHLKSWQHFYFNAFFPVFKEEDFDISKLPSHFINPEGSVSDVLREYEIKNDVSVWEYGSRSVWNDEKNFYEGDYHPNLLGYKIIADYIYEQIKDQICTKKKIV